MLLHRALGFAWQSLGELDKAARADEGGAGGGCRWHGAQGMGSLST